MVCLGGGNRLVLGKGRKLVRRWGEISFPVDALAECFALLRERCLDGGDERLIWRLRWGAGGRA